MNKKTLTFTFPAAAIVMAVAFLSIFIIASVNPVFAASVKKKAKVVQHASAVDFTESRIKQLETALKITEAQQASWDSLTQVMRENARELDAMGKDNSDAIKTMNAVESLKFYSQMTESRLNQQKKLIPVFEAFYNGLSDEQKKATDSIFRTGRYGKHKLN